MVIMTINILQISSTSQGKRGREGGIHVFHVVSFASVCYVKTGCAKVYAVQKTPRNELGGRREPSVLEFIYRKERRGLPATARAKVQALFSALTPPACSSAARARASILDRRESPF